MAYPSFPMWETWDRPQHMVLFNHIAVGHPNLFLEAIPHLRQYFKYPVMLENGYYAVPQVPGSTCDFVD